MGELIWGKLIQNKHFDDRPDTDLLPQDNEFVKPYSPMFCLQ